MSKILSGDMILSKLCKHNRTPLKRLLSSSASYLQAPLIFKRLLSSSASYLQAPLIFIVKAVAGSGNAADRLRRRAGGRSCIKGCNRRGRGRAEESGPPGIYLHFRERGSHVLSGHDVVVIGASSGGIEALEKLIAGLPEDLPAAVFVVVHLPAEEPSVLPRILDRAGPLPAAAAEDGQPVKPGRVYVARPDHHLLLEEDRVRLMRGPKENHHRPAVDPLFRSAAISYGRRVVGVVLSGVMSDGTAGLLAIKRRGGVAVVQDPDEALFSGMPRSALEHADVDYCRPAGELASLLARLVHERGERDEREAEQEGAYPVPDEMDLENRIARLGPETAEDVKKLGEPSGFTCPECEGPLWEIRDENLLRFRCRVGHAYTADSALDGKSEALERALWVALNTLHESAEMSRRLAVEAHARGNRRSEEYFEERAKKTEGQAILIRQVLTAEKDPAESEPAG